MAVAADARIHPTAVIDDGAVIGSGTKVWHFAHVRSGARIGARSAVGQGCYIGNVTIGDGVKIQNHVSVYDGVTLEDGVFCGPSCVFTNVFNPRAEVPRMDEVRPTVVRRGASIGANATIVCGVTLGEYCLVGAGAVITRNVAPYARVVGVPARRVGWMCACGETLEADSCDRCGRSYRVGADRVEPVTD